jgi:hypothetical protein
MSKFTPLTQCPLVLSLACKHEPGISQAGVPNQGNAGTLIPDLFNLYNTISV